MHLPHSLTSPRDACFTVGWILFSLWIFLTSGIYAPVALALLLLGTPASVAQPLLTARALLTLIYTASRMSRLAMPAAAASSGARVPLRSPSSLTQRPVVSSGGSGGGGSE